MRGPRSAGRGGGGPGPGAARVSRGLAGRCDFPRGDADQLCTSVHGRLHALPDATRVLVGHDHQPGGRALRHETTIGASRRLDVQPGAETTREPFVLFRRQRDATLAVPALLFPSVQVNIDAGRLPAPHASGRRYLRVPLDLGAPTDDDGTPRSWGCAAARRATRRSSPLSSR